VLCWNRAAEVVFATTQSSQEMSATVCTCCSAILIIAACLVDWRELAGDRGGGCFRAENAGEQGIPTTNAWSAWLTARSPEFRDFWHKHEVSRYTTIHKRIHHPQRPHGIRIQQPYRR